MVYGLGYNLGGGVMLEAAYFSVEQNQGIQKIQMQMVLYQK